MPVAIAFKIKVNQMNGAVHANLLCRCINNIRITPKSRTEHQQKRSKTISKARLPSHGNMGAAQRTRLDDSNRLATKHSHSDLIMPDIAISDRKLLQVLNLQQQANWKAKATLTMLRLFNMGNALKSRKWRPKHKTLYQARLCKI